MGIILFVIYSIAVNALILHKWFNVMFFSSLQRKNINARSSSSVHVVPEDQRSGPEHRLAHQPGTLPWAQGSSVHRDGPGAFLLDLHNFPDLSKADIDGQNPNIQVIVCVHELSSAL